MACGLRWVSSRSSRWTLEIDMGFSDLASRSFTAFRTWFSSMACICTGRKQREVRSIRSFKIHHQLVQAPATIMSFRYQV